MKFLLFEATVLAALCCGAAAGHSAAFAWPTHVPGEKPSTPEAAPPPDVELRKALDAAWLRSVAVRETAGQRERAVADRAITAAPWSAPPALEVGRREDRTSATGARETDLGLVVPIWWPGQRATLAQRTETAVGLANALELVERLRLAGSLRELAWEWAQLRTEADLADGQVNSLAALAEDVERRVRAGDLARADGMAARAEWLAAQAARVEVLRRLQAAQARWALVTGLPKLSISVPPSETLERPPDVSTGHVHPEATLAQLNRELAERSLEVVRAGKADAPELSLSLRQDSTARQAALPHSVAIGVRVPFGPQSRNLPRLATAHAALDTAQVQQERLNERLASEALTAREAWRAAQTQFESLNEGAVLLRERARLIDRAFRAGEVALPELLRTLAAAHAAEAAAARQRATWGLSRARLEQTLGILP